jgi:hypothetical protein
VDLAWLLLYRRLNSNDTCKVSIDEFVCAIEFSEWLFMLCRVMEALFRIVCVCTLLVLVCCYSVRLRIEKTNKLTIAHLVRASLWGLTPGFKSWCAQFVELKKSTCCVPFTRLNWHVVDGPSCMRWPKTWVKARTTWGSSLRKVGIYHMSLCLLVRVFYIEKQRVGPFI